MVLILHTLFRCMLPPCLPALHRTCAPILAVHNMPFLRWVVDIRTVGVKANGLYRADCIFACTTPAHTFAQITKELFAWILRVKTPARGTRERTHACVRWAPCRHARHLLPTPPHLQRTYLLISQTLPFWRSYHSLVFNSVVFCSNDWFVVCVLRCSWGIRSMCQDGDSCS